MKKTISFIILIFLVSFSVHASKVKGIIITKKDTLHVMFIIPFVGVDYAALQKGVKYVDSLGAKHKLRPEDATEIRFEYNGQVVRMLSRFDNLSYNSLGSSKIFLHLIIDGPLKLFNYYIKNQTMSAPGGAGGMPMTMGGGTYSKYILQKGAGDLVRYGKMNFKDDMPVFLKNCPELAKMIRDKVYQRDDIERIVNYYNTSCGIN